VLRKKMYIYFGTAALNVDLFALLGAECGSVATLFAQLVANSNRVVLFITVDHISNCNQLEGRFH
jgi:hypothetical protein